MIFLRNTLLTSLYTYDEVSCSGSDSAVGSAMSTISLRIWFFRIKSCRSML